MIKYVTEIHTNSSAWERRKSQEIWKYKKGLQADYNFDTKHGITRDQASSLLDRLRLDSSFSKLRNVENALQRLSEMQEYFASAKRYTSTGSNSKIHSHRYAGFYAPFIP